MTPAEARHIAASLLAMYPAVRLDPDWPSRPEPGTTWRDPRTGDYLPAEDWRPGPQYAALCWGLEECASYRAMARGLKDVFATWDGGRYGRLPDMPVLRAAHDVHVERMRREAGEATAERLMLASGAIPRDEQARRIAEIAGRIGDWSETGKRAAKRPGHQSAEEKLRRLKVLREQAASLAREGTYNRRSTPTRDSGVVEDDSASESA